MSRNPSHGRINLKHWQHLHSANGDADYVAAIGIARGDMVAIRQNYEDDVGNKLAESQTFYGNVGDKPVVRQHISRIMCRRRCR